MNTLDDTTAIYILKTIARTQLQSAQSEPIPSAELRPVLHTAFGEPSPSPVTEGDLARAALALLTEDPKFAEPIRVMASQSASSDGPNRYTDPAAIALTTAVLLVLQTRVKFKVEQDGKWSIEVDKKSAGDTALKLVVQRLLSLLDK